MDQLSTDVLSAGMTGEDVQWDLWNEPDCCGFWEPHRSQGQYLEMWKRFYRKLRDAIPGAMIVGPSTAGQPASTWVWMNTFLDYVKQNDCIPDIISWHELNTENDPAVSKKNMDAMLATRGISVPGAYQVNEYCASSETGPGNSAWYMARLERLGIDGLRANWGMHKKLYDTMGDLVRNHTGKIGTWWVYRRYTEMSGKLVRVLASDLLYDGIAGTDPVKCNSIIILGSRGKSGRVRVALINLNNAPYLVENGRVCVIVERMTMSVMRSPLVVRQEVCMVHDNQLVIEIVWPDADEGYCIKLCPESKSTLESA